MKVRTRYYGPTDTRGSRIRATANGRQVTIPYDYAASDPHAVAVRALADRLGIVAETITELDRKGVTRSYTVQTGI